LRDQKGRSDAINLGEKRGEKWVSRWEKKKNLIREARPFSTHPGNEKRKKL